MSPCAEVITARPATRCGQENPLTSIVIATYNRRAQLKHCLSKIRQNVSVRHEIIVVGGAAPDGTAEWLAAQPDITFIHETEREGATRAYNKGFRAARGRYVMWLNDDSYPLPGAVEAALDMLAGAAPAGVGMIAFYHNLEAPHNRLDALERSGAVYGIFNVRGFPYANFGLLSRDLLERLGFLDERYYFCAWDPDLSLKVQLEAGLKVVGCRHALIHHDELLDERKQGDLQIARADNAKLFAKWNLPGKFSYPDPAAQYQRMIRDLPPRYQTTPAQPG